MADPLYPAIEPYRSEHLDVGDGHRLYVEQAGDPEGIAVLCIHGGPGGASTPRQRRFFDPGRYRIVSFDQRGCGRSLPAGERRANDTAASLCDIERIRLHLGIERWLVFGGSWGAALAVLYAGAHAQPCLGLILRGAFLAGPADLDWFFHGAAALAPDAWAALDARIARDHGESLMAACLRQARGADEALAGRVVAAWLAWEAALSRPWLPPPVAAAGVSAATLAAYRLQADYLERCFDLHEGQVLAAADQARGLPCALIHGRFDWVCRPAGAWALWRSLPGARLRLVEQAGHDSYPPAMAKALREAADAYPRNGGFDELGSEWLRS
ncbi:MAG: alpha/beta fold hydrolase [Burkholderiaceae bacterium]